MAGGEDWPSPVGTNFEDPPPRIRDYLWGALAAAVMAQFLVSLAGAA